MTAADSILALTRDPRLSPHAMSAIPAWLWAPDATRVIWSNVSGAAVLGAGTPAELAEQRFEPEHPFAADVARLAETLSKTGAQRLERLRGTGSNLVCTCARVTVAETPGILVVASEPAKSIPLAARAARLFSVSAEPLAVF